MIPGQDLRSVDPGCAQMTLAENEEEAVIGPRKDVMLICSIVPSPPWLSQRSFKSASLHVTASASKCPGAVEAEEVTGYQWT